MAWFPVYWRPYRGRGLLILCESPNWGFFFRYLLNSFWEFYFWISIQQISNQQSNSARNTPLQSFAPAVSAGQRCLDFLYVSCNDIRRILNFSLFPLDVPWQQIPHHTFCNVTCFDLWHEDLPRQHLRKDAHEEQYSSHHHATWCNSKRNPMYPSH